MSADLCITKGARLGRACAVNCQLATDIATDGKLSQGTITPTGGQGSNSIDGTTNKPAAPDALIGQSALTIAGQVSLASQIFNTHGS